MQQNKIANAKRNNFLFFLFFACHFIICPPFFACHFYLSSLYIIRYKDYFACHFYYHHKILFHIFLKLCFSFLCSHFSLIPPPYPLIFIVSFLSGSSLFCLILSSSSLSFLLFLWLLSFFSHFSLAPLFIVTSFYFVFSFLFSSSSDSSLSFLLLSLFFGSFFFSSPPPPSSSLFPFFTCSSFKKANRLNSLWHRP